MAFESVTDERIAELISMPKKVMNPGARPKIKDGNEKYNYKLRATDNDQYEFELYTR